jgi:hypothetical protein
MATDPTSGAGYGFGAQLPSAHMTTIATQQPGLVDSVTGGTWPGNHIWTGNHTFSGQLGGTPTGGVLDLSATTLTIAAADIAGVLNMSAAGSGIAYRTGTLVNADANLSKAIDEYRFTVAPSVARTYTLLDASSTPADGQRLRVIMTISSPTADAIFKRETGATEIGRIKGLNNGGWLEFTYHSAGNGWYVSGCGQDGQVTLHT